MLLADFQQLVDDLVRDKDQVITPVARGAAIEAALARYSADAPRLVVEDVTSAGGSTLDLPAGWAPAWSWLAMVEYPIGRTPPAEINLAGTAIYTAPVGEELRLVLSLAPGDVVRLTYAAPHVLSASVNTIPAAHRRPVAALAASDLCGQLASFYATEGAPTIGADTTDHLTKTERWTRRARDLRSDYTSVVGSAPSARDKPASATVQLPSRDSIGGRRLFHPPSDWPRTP